MILDYNLNQIDGSNLMAIDSDVVQFEVINRYEYYWRRHYDDDDDDDDYYYDKYCD